MEDGIARTALDPDCGERFKPLRRELGVTTFGLNQIVLEPRQQGRIHRHRTQEEVYLVLEGTLTIAVDGAEHELGPGELMRVAPAVRRRLLNRGTERVVLVALGGAKEHEGRDGEAFRDWDATDWVAPRDLPLPEDLPD
ncbi:MAG: cupin domain-containing protein [Solirubrobacteraceae bacterium]